MYTEKNTDTTQTLTIEDIDKLHGFVIMYALPPRQCRQYVLAEILKQQTTQIMRTTADAVNQSINQSINRSEHII